MVCSSGEDGFNLNSGAILNSEEGDYKLYNYEDGVYSAVETQNKVLAYDNSSSGYICIEDNKHYVIHDNKKYEIKDENYTGLKGKYISLEAKIAKNKDLYYDALAKSQVGWHDAKEDAVPFIKYLLGTILAAYRDFEDRFSLVETKRSALDTVRQASMQKIGRFTKQDIRELCPSLSISSIEAALRKMVDDGEIKREGNGKATFYFRLK